MNFFEQQDRAKRQTWLLVALFTGAVLSLIFMTVLLIYFGLLFDVVPADAKATPLETQLKWLAWISTAIVSIVGLACVFRWFQVSKGGYKVAESLGGKLINDSTTNPDERKLLNVVEEMAIASGSGVPLVYVIEDPAINAFAAGLTPQDAVIGVTRGSIEHLSRSELQGVVAHEFSHIFNGDMRLNLRLVSLLYGIVFIGILGQLALRGGYFSGSHRYRSRSGSSQNNNSGAQLAVVGLGLIVIGWFGSFFGNWIKSAISRQREYLADASAVQFTRDPTSIAGALKKIGGFTLGSRLEVAGSEEFSHMFFGQSHYRMFNQFPTHPPLEKRIARVDPNWDGVFPKIQLKQPTPLAQKPEAKEKLAPLEFVGALAACSASDSNKISEALDKSIESIGTTTPAHLAYSTNLIQSIPRDFRDAAHDMYSARALIYVLVVNLSENQVKQTQLALLKQRCDPGVYREVKRLYAIGLELHRAQYLPLVELSVPALKQVPTEHYEVFSNNLVSLIKADGKISLFEFSIHLFLKHQITGKPQGCGLKLTQVRHEMQWMFAAIMQEIGLDTQQIEQQLKRAMRVLNFDPKDIHPLAISDAPITKKQLSVAVRKLQTLQPLQKPIFLKGLKQCVLLQSPPTLELTEFFRVMASLLDCPTPPLINTGQAEV